jgi:hypothetical protein
MAASPQNDTLATVAGSGFSTDWDWKGDYVSSLAEDGYERFAQYSASPDSTLLFAGPARFSGLSGNASSLVPIGLADNISVQTDAGLARLFEIGSNRSFFTRGKSTNAMSMTKLLADQANILMALTVNAYRPAVADQGVEAPTATSPNTNISMNLDSEYFGVPFGLLLISKTKGAGLSGYGKVLAAVYCEYCMFQNYSFSIVSTQPVISEGPSMQFDRMVPVSFSS